MEDYVLVADEPPDQGAGVGREVTGPAAVVAGAFRDRAKVVVPDPLQRGGIELVLSGGAGLVCEKRHPKECSKHSGSRSKLKA